MPTAESHQVMRLGPTLLVRVRARGIKFQEVLEMHLRKAQKIKKKEMALGICAAAGRSLDDALQKKNWQSAA